MAVRRARLVLGNWKMNGDVASSEALIAGVLADMSALDRQLDGVGAGVFPPYPYLGLAAARLAGSPIGWGAQDVSAHDNGAFTGEVSARMLADLGCTWVLVGHSERRSLFGDTDDEVVRKTGRALEAGLVPVVCVGETRQEREAGLTESVLARQVDAVSSVLASAGSRAVLAYEPVWAIGTGKTATSAQAQEVHAFIRQVLTSLHGEAVARRVRIQYGGSVKGSNARELLQQPDIDGALVGGASLESKGFVEIIKNAI